MYSLLLTESEIKFIQAQAEAVLETTYQAEDEGDVDLAVLPPASFATDEHTTVEDIQNAQAVVRRCKSQLFTMKE